MIAVIVTESGVSRQSLEDAGQAPGDELFREKNNTKQFFFEPGFSAKPRFWFTAMGWRSAKMWLLMCK
jgi:hypothetical protein